MNHLIENETVNVMDSAFTTDAATANAEAQSIWTAQEAWATFLAAYKLAESHGQEAEIGMALTPEFGGMLGRILMECVGLTNLSDNDRRLWLEAGLYMGPDYAPAVLNAVRFLNRVI